jgi:hypothetical protein
MATISLGPETARLSELDQLARPAWRNWQQPAEIQQQLIQLCLKALDGLQRWIRGQIGCQSKARVGGDVVAMATHQRKQGAILGPDRIEFRAAGRRSI